MSGGTSHYGVEYTAEDYPLEVHEAIRVLGDAVRAKIQRECADLEKRRELTYRELSHARAAMKRQKRATAALERRLDPRQTCFVWPATSTYDRRYIGRLAGEPWKRVDHLQDGVEQNGYRHLERAKDILWPRRYRSSRT